MQSHNLVQHVPVMICWNINKLYQFSPTQTLVSTAHLPALIALFNETYFVSHAADACYSISLH